MSAAEQITSTGTRVSYEDQANLRRVGTVTQITDSPWSPFEITWDDGRVSSSDCRQAGWRVECDAEAPVAVLFTARAYDETWYGSGDAMGWQFDEQGERCAALLSPKMRRRVELAMKRAWEAAFEAACVAKGAVA